jgi:hypothetical protein
MGNLLCRIEPDLSKLINQAWFHLIQTDLESGQDLVNKPSPCAVEIYPDGSFTRFDFIPLETVQAKPLSVLIDRNCTVALLAVIDQCIEGPFVRYETWKESVFDPRPAFIAELNMKDPVNCVVWEMFRTKHPETALAFSLHELGKEFELTSKPENGVLRIVRFNAEQLLQLRDAVERRLKSRP